MSAPAPALAPAGSGSVRELVLASAMVALGVVTPIVFHMLGLGRTFLPMHLPVLLAALLVRPGTAAMAAVVTPWLSSFMTGMPPAPIAVLMSFELAALAVVASGLLRVRVPGPVAVAAAVAARCAVTFVVGSALGRWLGLPPNAAGWASIVAGAPGIALQLVTAAPAAAYVRRRMQEG